MEAPVDPEAVYAEARKRREAEEFGQGAAT
jgi:hypothetical protein